MPLRVVFNISDDPLLVSQSYGQRATVPKRPNCTKYFAQLGKKLAIGWCSVLTALACGSYGATATAANIPVDMELQILIDVSGSIDSIEWATQWQGWGQAITELGAEGAFTSGPNGRVAVNVVAWSDISLAALSTWAVIDSASAAAVFAEELESIQHATAQGFGGTAPGTAINSAYPLFESNNFDSSRQIILVSGDGVQNAGDDTGNARDAALAAGVDQITGLYIVGDPSDPPDVLKEFYATKIRGGAGSFVSGVATGHTDLDLFKQAIHKNIGFTLNSTVYPAPPDAIFVPEPSTLALVVIGALALLAGRARSSDREENANRTGQNSVNSGITRERACV